MAQLGLAAAGGIIGGIFGGPVGAQAGFLAGSFLGAFLFGEDIPGEINEGPRLGELAVSSSIYGSGIPETYGSVRMSGNMIWGTDIVEVRREDTETVGGKGGGGTSVTQVTFSYFGRFAMAFAMGPADSIRKVWADGKLLVDLEQASGGLRHKYSPRHYREYLGTETQLPDPLIESIEGVGTVPAHRGLVYMVFDDLPLADFGNRIPNITAEIVKNASVANTFDVLTGAFFKDKTLMSSDTPFMYNFDVISGRIQKINRYTKEVVIDKAMLADDDLAAACAARRPSGAPFTGVRGEAWVDKTNGDVWWGVFGSSFAEMTVQYDRNLIFKQCYDTTPSGISSNNSSGRTLRLGLKTYLVIGINNPFGGGVNLFDINENTGGRTLLFTGMGGTITNTQGGFAIDAAGERAWVMNFNSTDGSTHIAKINVDGTIGTARDTGTSIGAVDKALAITYDIATDRVILISTGKLEYLDPDTLDKVDEFAPAGGVSKSTFNTSLWADQDAIDGTLYTSKAGADFLCIDTVNKVILQTFDLTVLFPLGFSAVVFDPKLFVLWDNAGPQYTRIFLDRVSDAGVSLASIVDDISIRAGLTAGDIVSTDLNATTVVGYVIPRPMPARNAIEPLRQAFFFDGLESDFKLNYRSRDRGSGTTIPDDDLIVSEDGGSRKIALTEPRQQELEIPRRISISYMFKPNDYQIATQQAQRIQLAVGATGELKINLPIVLTNDQAKDVAMTTLGSAWIERAQTDFSLSVKYVRLDPTDVVTIQKTRDAISVNVVTRLADSDLGGALQQRHRGVALDQTIFNPNVTGSPVQGAPVGPIKFDTPSKMFLFNLPNLKQNVSDDDGGLYAGAAPEWFDNAVDWRGTVYWRADSLAGNFSEWEAITARSDWLISATKLADQPRWTVWDDDNTVDVMVQGTAVLASATDLDVLNGANLILLGNELLQFVTATLVSDKTYRLSRLLRGRMGTNVFTGTHNQSEEGVIINRAKFVKASDFNEFGLQKFYKPITIGQDIASTLVSPFTNTSECFRIWSPAGAKGARDGSNNLTVTFIRRARHSGEWLDLVDVPVQDQTVFDADILDTPGGTVLRQFLGLSSPTFTYTAGDQTTDGFTPGDPIPMEIYQVSANTGRGYANVTTL